MLVDDFNILNGAWNSFSFLPAHCEFVVKKGIFTRFFAFGFFWFCKIVQILDCILLSVVTHIVGEFIHGGRGLDPMKGFRDIQVFFLSRFHFFV